MKTPGSIKSKVRVRQIESKLIPEIYGQIQGKPVSQAIQTVESSLAEIPPTPFHAVSGRHFLQNFAGLAGYLVEFHAKATTTAAPAAIYCEMNGFSINPDLWYLDAFAYHRYGGLRDTEWLCRWDSPKHPIFPLTGMEDIQEVFQRHSWSSTTPLETRFAKTVAEFVIVLRFCELVGKAHEHANASSACLRGLPVLASAHDYDCLYESR